MNSERNKLTIVEEGKSTSLANNQDLEFSENRDKLKSRGNESQSTNKYEMKPSKNL